MFQALQTIYHGPSNVRGARVLVKAPALTRARTIPWNHALNTEGNHRAAAETVARELGWEGKMHSGSLVDGYAHVFESADGSAVI